MHVFITGGAGLIGCNLTLNRLSLGDTVTIFDNLSRPRTEHNLDWLQSQAGGEKLNYVPGAVRSAVFYASAYKVYGGMEQVAVVEGKQRFTYRDIPAGIAEDEPLDFHTPYACSKGAGDQVWPAHFITAIISNNGKAARILGWELRISIHDGVRELWIWVARNRHLFS